METNSYRRELRGKIISRATAMFMERGIRSVKMDDIAQSLSISKRTLYEVFADKESLLYEVITTHDAEFHKKIERITTNDTDVMEMFYHFYSLIMEELNKFNPVFLEDVVKYPSVIEKIERSTQSKHLAFIEFAKRGVSEGFFMPGLDYGLVEDIIDMASRQMKVKMTAKRYGIKKTFITASIMLLRGMCTEKGIKRFDEIVAQQL